MERLKAEKRRFEYRERTLMGFLGNALALVRPGMLRTGKGFLPMLFTLLVSGKARRELMLARQALAKKALSEKQAGSRKARADKLRHIRDAQLGHAVRRLRHPESRRSICATPQEIKQQKQEWRDLSAERDRLWAEWRAEFGIRERPRRQGDGSHAGRGRSRRRGRPNGQSGRRQGPCPAGPETPR